MEISFTVANTKSSECRRVLFVSGGLSPSQGLFFLLLPVCTFSMKEIIYVASIFVINLSVFELAV